MGFHASVGFTVNLAGADKAALAEFLANNQPQYKPLRAGATPAEQVLALLCECGEYDNDGDIDPTTGEISVYVDGRYSDSVGLEELSLTGATIMERGQSSEDDSVWQTFYSAGAMLEKVSDVSRLFDAMDAEMAPTLATVTEARLSSSPDTLTELAASDDEFIRAQAASNPATPTEVLARLETDPARSVRDSAQTTLARLAAPRPVAD